MSEHVLSIVSGHCPEADDEEEIEISFVEVRAIGMHGFKKTGFHCDYADEHGCSDSNNCPLFLSAPEPT